MTKQQFIQNEEERLRKAFLANDTEVIAELFHADCQFILPNGEVLTRAAILDKYKGSDTDLNIIEQMNYTNQVISITGDTATTTQRVRIEGKYLGKAISGQFCYIRFWMHEGARWMVIGGAGVPVS